MNRHVPGKAVVGCVNQTSSTTLSGDADTIDKLFLLVKGDEHVALKINYDVACHSLRMQAVLDKFRQYLTHITPLFENPTDAKFLSPLHLGIFNSSELGPELGLQHGQPDQPHWRQAGYDRG
ncbi:beta-ketoacyl synthase domain-containing protein [Colletotrichum asianum]|uniref:Beta-ketoacyl synthase domain-containing protein n=1 Tax=Colletotrichum asianum TaxID=702518 RepID=A0A8H3W2K7_9PEZI|nr:beta-ketoacyl synthase domain-containing protein [Colletotrichum asianum]